MQKRQQKLQRKKDMFAQMRQELETNRNRKKKAETKKPFDDMIERLELAEKRMFGEPVVIDEPGKQKDPRMVSTDMRGQQRPDS